MPVDKVADHLRPFDFGGDVKSRIMRLLAKRAYGAPIVSPTVGHHYGCTPIEEVACDSTTDPAKAAGDEDVTTFKRHGCSTRSRPLKWALQSCHPNPVWIAVTRRVDGVHDTVTKPVHLRPAGRASLTWSSNLQDVLMVGTHAGSATLPDGLASRRGLSRSGLIGFSLGMIGDRIFRDAPALLLLIFMTAYLAVPPCSSLNC